MLAHWNRSVSARAARQNNIHREFGLEETAMLTQNVINTTHNTASDVQQTKPRTVLMPAAAVIVLGAVLLLFTAFAPLSEVHNAAHDSRHAIGAPCH